MRVLLTNDDGIDASGLRALYQSVVQSLGNQLSEICVVAPDRCRSECSHSVTHSANLSVVETQPGWHSVSGTPVDCVRVALHAMRFDPQVIFSGVNAGANLGINLTVSGTFAAAREGALSGIPSLAISHYRRPDVAKTWEHVPQWSESTLRSFADRATTWWADALKPQGSQSTEDAKRFAPLWNVNLPAIDPATTQVPVVNVPVDPMPIPRCGFVQDGAVSYELDFHNRPRLPGTDVDACFGGSLTVSEVNPLGF